MTISQATPITAFVPVPPDADWETVRARVMAALAATATPAQTDHNAADPGVTLAEVAAYGLADLHYRVAERGLDEWPLDARAWGEDTGRHWHSTLPVNRFDPGLDPDDPALNPNDLAPLTFIAGSLAAASTSAAVLEPRVRQCRSRADALALLSADPWADAFRPQDRPAVAALMRSRLVRRIAQEQADVIAGVVAAKRDPDDVAAGDARAAAELAFSLPLWEEEIVALVRRERRRLSRETLVTRLAEVHAATAASASAIQGTLQADGLDAVEARIAMAAAAQPIGMVPEDLEDDQGRSSVWPPHPIQALTCEPVTADDYARRARAHPEVGRAWSVPGRLPGIAWNGLPTGTLSTIEVDEAAAAVTLVVERVAGAGSADAFLRAVLTTAVGPEATAPFPDWRTDIDELEPRRVICDEVGASLLLQAPILVQATLVTDIGVDRDTVIEDVRARISAFFAGGRPETSVPSQPQTVEGPWPRIEQPVRGWVPGEPVRFTEVVEAIVGNPLVWGVERLAMKVEGDPDFLPQSAGSLAIPRNAVPTLAAARCIRVRFALRTECGDA